MARTTRTVLILGLIAMGLSGCGRRGALEAPPGAVTGAPDVTSRQPAAKPIEVNPPQPEEKPDDVKAAPAQ